MPIPLSASFLAEQQGHYEPMRSNNGFMVVRGLPGWEAEGKEIQLSLESFPLPKENNAQIELPYQNSRRKVLGPANVEDMEVVIRDFVDKDVMQLLWSWRRRVAVNAGTSLLTPRGLPVGGDILGNDTGGAEMVGLARDYKYDVDIYTYAPNGQFIQVWGLGGVWPSAMDPGDIDHTSEDTNRITMTMVIDRIRSYPAALSFGAGAVGGGTLPVLPTTSTP